MLPFSFQFSYNFMYGARLGKQGDRGSTGGSFRRKKRFAAQDDAPASSSKAPDRRISPFAATRSPATRHRSRPAPTPDARERLGRTRSANSRSPNRLTGPGRDRTFRCADISHPRNRAWWMGITGKNHKPQGTQGNHHRIRAQVYGEPRFDDPVSPVSPCALCG